MAKKEQRALTAEVLIPKSKGNRNIGSYSRMVGRRKKLRGISGIYAKEVFVSGRTRGGINIPENCSLK